MKKKPNENQHKIEFHEFFQLINATNLLIAPILPVILLWRFVVLVCHMQNLFDYFDCKLETDLVHVVAVDQSALLSCDFHPQMDCILLKCSMVEQHGQLVEQLDPILVIDWY